MAKQKYDYKDRNLVRLKYVQFNVNLSFVNCEVPILYCIIFFYGRYSLPRISLYDNHY